VNGRAIPESGASCHRWSVDISLSRRRAALPIALLAAIAIAAGGGSSPWSVRPTPPATLARPAAAPVGLPLEHIELVAMRAQETNR